MDGVIVLHKPKGKTSHDMVGFLRRLLSVRRIGHTGTLDPDATGVLPLCVGMCTKASQYIMDSEKTYVATMQLGAATTTQDASGEVTNKAEVQVSQAQIEQTIQSFIGEIMQIPPMYSAVKVDGKKLYTLAREGIEIERKPRKVQIHGIQILDIDMQAAMVRMEVTCSKGTYIRTLIHDIGEKLGCFAHMTDLVRTKSGGFTLDEAYTCEELVALKEAGKLSEAILPTERVFAKYPEIVLNEKNTQRARNGVTIRYLGVQAEQRYRVYGVDGAFLCLSVGREDGSLKMITSFWSE